MTSKMLTSVFLKNPSTLCTRTLSFQLRKEYCIVVAKLLVENQKLPLSLVMAPTAVLPPFIGESLSYLQ